MTFVPTSISSACAHNGRASRARARQQGVASQAFEVSIAFKLCHQHITSSRKVASLKQHCALRPLVDDCASTCQHTRAKAAQGVRCDSPLYASTSSTSRFVTLQARQHARAQALRAHKGEGMEQQGRHLRSLAASSRRCCSRARASSRSRASRATAICAPAGMRPRQAGAARDTTHTVTHGLASSRALPDGTDTLAGLRSTGCGRGASACSCVRARAG
jgi:hypothetical protein